MEDKDGNILDIIEDTSELTDTMTTSTTHVTLVQGTSGADINIMGNTGAVTATVKDSSNAAYAKITAAISGDNDTVILAAAADAAAGNYTLTLTDTESKTTVIYVTVVAA